jgi:CBS domain-containing protein
MYRSPYLVGDVMSRPVVAVLQGAAFKEIVETMNRWQVSALPVLADGNLVVGVVSEADLLPKEEFRDSDPPRMEQARRLDDLAKAGATTAEQIMTSPAVTIHADATLAQAARLMAHARVKRLPVVDTEGALQGVVSRSDLLKVFLRPDDELAAEIRREVLDRLFPAFAGEIQVRVVGGVATLSGRIHDSSLVPVVARLVRAVEGIVDVEWALDPAPQRHQPSPAPTGSNPSPPSRNNPG